jgi:hypothetical protein
MAPSRELRSVVHRTLLFLVGTVLMSTPTQVTVRLLTTSVDHDQEAIFFSQTAPTTHSNVRPIQAGSNRQVDAILSRHIVTYSDYTDTIKSMEGLADDLFQGKICEHITSVRDHVDTNTSMAQRSSFVRVRFHCRALFEQSGLGTGNYISAIYALRLAAEAMGNVTHVEFLCSDAHDEASNLILPWLTGVFPLQQHLLNANALDRHPLLSLEHACRPYQSVPIGYAFDDIKWEMRRLAVALVGIPYPGHPSERWVEEHLWPSLLSSQKNTNNNVYQLPHPQLEDAPLIPHVELDDAVLHFRCGDLIFSNLSRFGFMKFASYSRHLDANITSIGIATQPFEAGRNVRKTDVDMKKKPERCRHVIDAFVEHLHDTFPNARVTVRNDPNESIALTFARMVMAQQVVIGISTFGVFPALASFGRSYIRDPDYMRAPNQWLLEPWFRKRAEAGGMTLIQEPRMTGFECRRLWGDDGSAVLNWLRS